MNRTAIFLGGIAGFTIFLGLPIAFVRNLSARARGFLTAMSTGILVFLLVEITGKVIDSLEDLCLSSAGGFHTSGDLWMYGAIFAVGLFVGLMGLVYFEKRFIVAAAAARHTSGEASPSVWRAPAPARDAHRLSCMIAIGLGLHNLSEGLAIGQAFGWGNTQLALLLVIGFALHNATEGFGIVAPLAGQPTSWGFLGAMGLIGGGPTLLGTIVGSFWTIKPVEILFLSLASGSILYIIGELLHLGHKLKEEAIGAAGLLTGFFLAFVTDLVIVVASGGIGRS